MPRTNSESDSVVLHDPSSSTTLALLSLASSQEMTDTSEDQSATMRPSARTTVSSGSHFSTQSEHLIRPLRFFHPTRAELTPQHSVPRADAAALEKSRWSSRASRKNRFTSGVIHVRHNPEDEELGSKAIVPVNQRIRHPESRLKVHLTSDVSFWVAVIFVLGSTAWVSALIHVFGSLQLTKHVDV